MVVGLKCWREHFADYADRYVLVGGVACEQVMEEVGLTFRLTKDFDVVLLVELLDAAFADVFWAFIEAGGYPPRFHTASVEWRNGNHARKRKWVPASAKGGPCSARYGAAQSDVS